MKRVFVGVDPGSTSSATGVFAYDAETLDIITFRALRSQQKEFHFRLREIALHFSVLLYEASRDLRMGSLPVEVFIESFVMRGKSGEMLARLTGALLSKIEPGMKLRFVPNTRVKKALTGHGRGDKLAVARAVEQYFSKNIASAQTLNELRSHPDWSDIFDAAAIAIAGHISEEQNK